MIPPTYIGWLIASEKRRSQAKKIDHGWNLCNTLQSEFHIKHFLLKPPWHCKNCLTTERQTQLQLKNFSGPLSKNLVIQQVRVAPETLRVIRLKNELGRTKCLKWLQPFYDYYNISATNTITSNVPARGTSPKSVVPKQAKKSRLLVAPQVIATNRTSAFLQH